MWCWQRVNTLYRLLRLGHSLPDAVIASRTITDQETDMSESPQNLTPAVIDHDDGQEVRIPATLDPSRGNQLMWLSWKPSTDLDRANVLAALTGTVPKLGTQANVTLHVVNVAFQGVQLVSKETGELIPAVRTILFTADGRCYSAVSGGVGASLGAIFTLWGYPPWTPPLPLSLKQHELTGGKRYYTLEFDATANRPARPDSAT